jgi:hypothetical protein
MTKTVSCNILFLCLIAGRSFGGQPSDTIKKEIGTSIEISDFIGRPNDLKSFIDSNFDSVVDDDFRNPMLPYRVDFISRTDSLKFCGMILQQCWVQKIDTLYSFFMIIKQTSDIKNHISGVYGNCNVAASVTAEGININDSLFLWRLGHVNIDQSRYYNVFRDPKFEECDLIIFGNMKFTQRVSRGVNWKSSGPWPSPLGLWEKPHNSAFKGVEFDAFIREAGSDAFVLSPTYAHKDIAF